MRSFIQPAVFDLELESKVGSICSPTPTPLLAFYCRLPAWYKFLSLPSLLLPLKSKLALIIFAEKIPSIRSPKSRLLCRLFQKNHFYFSFWQKFHTTVIITWNIRARILGGLSGYQNCFPLPLNKRSLNHR